MNVNSEQIKEIYADLFSSFAKTGISPQVKLEFYPYVGINSRIRLRDKLLHIKISDILFDAPLSFHRALAEILIRKLFRKRVSADVLQVYREYIGQPEIREKSIASRRIRGRKVLNGTQGEIYDLQEIFTLLNQIYFQNTVPNPQLTWSANKTYRILGHHDSTHETIVISKSLDSRKVPRFVVEYVVYHEMLHIKHPTRYQNGRRYNHTPAFRRDEKEFAFYEEAKDWIEKNAANLKKQAKRKNTGGFIKKLFTKSS